MGYLLQDLQVISRGGREVHEDVHVQRDVGCRCHCHGERLLVACNSMQQPVQQDVMVPPAVRAQTGCTGQPGLRVASTWWGRTWTFPVVSSSYQGGGGGPQQVLNPSRGYDGMYLLQLHAIHWASCARGSPRAHQQRAAAVASRHTRARGRVMYQASCARGVCRQYGTHHRDVDVGHRVLSVLIGALARLQGGGGQTSGAGEDLGGRTRANHSSPSLGSSHRPQLTYRPGAPEAARGLDAAGAAGVLHALDR